MCLQLFSLDRDLGDFFRAARQQGHRLSGRADRRPWRAGHSRAPARAGRAGRRAGRCHARPPRTMGKAIGAKLGLKGPVLYRRGPFGDMYVDRALSPADQARAKAAAVAAYRAHPQVEAVFTKEQLRRDAVADRAARQMEPDRARPRLVRRRALGRLRRPAEARHHADRRHRRSYVATHGSPWDYDRRVPILFWRRGHGAVAIAPTPIETADIMPTLAASIGLAVDAELDRRPMPGRCSGDCLPGALSHLKGLLFS